MTLMQIPKEEHPPDCSDGCPETAFGETKITLPDVIVGTILSYAYHRMDERSRCALGAVHPLIRHAFKNNESMFNREMLRISRHPDKSLNGTWSIDEIESHEVSQRTRWAQLLFARAPTESELRSKTRIVRFTLSKPGEDHPFRFLKSDRHRLYLTVVSNFTDTREDILAVQSGVCPTANKINKRAYMGLTRHPYRLKNDHLSDHSDQGGLSDQLISHNGSGDQIVIHTEGDELGYTAVWIPPGPVDEDSFDARHQIQQFLFGECYRVALEYCFNAEEHAEIDAEDARLQNTGFLPYRQLTAKGGEFPKRIWNEPTYLFQQRLLWTFRLKQIISDAQSRRPVFTIRIFPCGDMAPSLSCL